MSHSLNEIEALCKRAARGAGLSWGMAEEAGRAARWLASHDLAGPALLSQVLEQNDGVPHAQVAPLMLDADWRAAGEALCPLAAGTTLNDHANLLADGRSIKMSELSFPLLIVPFAAWAALHIKQPVRLTWQDMRVETDGDGLWIDDPRSQTNTTKAATITCQPTVPRQDAAQRPGPRGNVDEETWVRLSAFAHRTYAPATDASRLLGAGAGVNDND